MAKKDVIAAVSALSKIAEIKQYKLAIDYAHLIQSKFVIDINNDIVNKIGINLLGPSGNLSIADIIKYEEQLEVIINNILSQKLPNAFLADEIELLKNTKTLALNDFRSIKIDLVSATAKLVLKQIGINAPSIIAMIKDATKVQSIDKEQNNILVLSALSVKSRKLLTLSHVHIGNQITVKQKPAKVSSVFENAVANGRPDKLASVASCFLLSLNNPLLEEDSLVHLFMQGILKYGVNTTIGNQTRKFFLKGVTSSLLLNPADEIRIEENIHGSMSGTMEVSKTRTGYEYSFVYNLATASMIRDYKIGNYMS